MAKRGRHALVWIFRGSGHIHAWQGRCARDAWWSMSGRRETVERMYHDHVRATEATRHRDRGDYRPQALTPVSELPETLRPLR